ncbi:MULTISPECIES: ACP S-malonyltransferase [Cetobacterium]|uniref:Malonyl CoA-acyl carrier protein transacylase n=1 Tax=Candidatus Cetobacterium colombiensis TaxID=3073100 RepID=A0ABU4WD86_9FUSO|nr:ACP S-malonyltransferase [Candidatus Cetobacterium colombiensis]MDX8336669.1 ACP S-malonyltransferase [Candidatus Cetobacterium colombiensis]
MNKIAFVFPGQGTQYVGMGKELYENNDLAKKEFDKIFSNLDFDLKTVMFEGSEEDLKDTKNTQPAIVAMSLVLEKLLREKGIEPNYVAGHSVGEYAAIGSAGFLPMEEAVKLTSLRGKAMSKVSGEVAGSMAAIIGLDSDKIVETLESIEGIVEAVNFNEPKQTVIAGEKEAIGRACVALKEAGARRAMELAVSGPFHSSLMQPAGEILKEALEQFDFKNAEISLVANTTAKEIKDVNELKEELYRQSFGPVKWVDTIVALKEAGVTKIYEIGPGKVLNGLIKKIDKEIEVINIEKLSDLV